MSEWYLQEPGTSNIEEIAKSASSESRSAERYFVRWKMAIVFEEQAQKPTFHGRTHDLSLVGTGMLIGKNIQPTSGPVIVLLAPPPLSLKERPRIIEIKSRQLDAVYSGPNSSFRLGFAFLEFKNDGFDLLADRLKHHKSIAPIQAAKPLQ
ncbi:MAG: hypothetical protein NTX56_06550 [Proteobacteria bacterium]|nr:hypothetical protein [Pseudomonadota bacterium]